MYKKYTAEDYRKSAKTASDWAFLTTAEMLRQAADLMEREEKREKKYEYSARYSDDVVIAFHFDTLEGVKNACAYARSVARIVRREVGEWEVAK